MLLFLHAYHVNVNDGVRTLIKQQSRCMSFLTWKNYRKKYPRFKSCGMWWESYIFLCHLPEENLDRSLLYVMNPSVPRQLEDGEWCFISPRYSGWRACSEKNAVTCPWVMSHEHSRVNASKWDSTSKKTLHTVSPPTIFACCQLWWFMRF